jgi:nitrite reductase/ring-hydroxylating ferredoxin subunit
MSLQMTAQENAWHPVARSDDLPPRDIFQAQLHGVELAVWRADDGRVNAWENRCAHRSVRLTLGGNTGETLRCRYHGWQYRSGDGRCTFIPAATSAAPPPAVRARTFAAAEVGGYVWVNLAAQAVDASDKVFMPTFEPLPLSLRSLPFNAAPGVVAAELMRYADYDETAVPGSGVVLGNDTEIDLAWHAEGGRRQARFWLQPVDACKTVVHGSAHFAGIDRSGTLHDCNRMLTALRRRAELLRYRLSISKEARK